MEQLHCEEKKDNEVKSTEEMIQELLTEINLLLDIDHITIRKERFINGVFCPHCLQQTGRSVSNYVQYGFVKGTKWRRYCCRQCKRIFSDLTNTLFHRSRYVHKWPLFIKLVIVDRLPLKQIASIIKLHPNTVYAWNKKLIEFTKVYLPNKQHLVTDSYDQFTVQVKCTRKGRRQKLTNENAVPRRIVNNRMIPIKVAVYRENPSHVLLSSEPQPIIESLNQSNKNPIHAVKISAQLRSYISKKRGISVENLSDHLIWIRFLILAQAINPQILTAELFKLCLDKQNLSKSNRLLKRLI